MEHIPIRVLAIVAALLAGHRAGWAAEGGPLACDHPLIDVGETFDRDQVHKFLLRNSSQGTVRITATKKACGCVQRELTKYELAVGETCELTLKFPIRTKPGTIGTFVERLELFVNDKNDAPALVVTVQGSFVPIAYRLRDGIYIEVPTTAGSPFSGGIEVFVNKARGVKVTGIESVGAIPLNVRVAKLEVAVNPDERKLWIEVKGKSGEGIRLPASAAIVVKLNSDEMPELRIPVTLYSPHDQDMRFSPQQVAFGVVRSGATVERTIIVENPKSSQFVVEKAEASGDGVTATIDAKVKATNVTLLHCELDTSGLSGAITQDLLITVAAPDGSRAVFKLPVSAFVQAAATERTNKE